MKKKNFLKMGFYGLMSSGIAINYTAADFLANKITTTDNWLNLGTSLIVGGLAMGLAKDSITDSIEAAKPIKLK